MLFCRWVARRGRCYHGGVPSTGDWGGWVTVETLGVVPFLPVGFCLSTSGWQTRAGTCSPGAAGFCPRFIFRETLPQSDSSGPRAESRLLLEVIPSSQHLPLSFPPPQNWVRCQLSLSPSLPGVTTSQCWGFSFGADTRSPKRTSSWVAAGLRLPPLVPVSPAHGDKDSFGKTLQAIGN